MSFVLRRPTIPGERKVLCAASLLVGAVLLASCGLHQTPSVTGGPSVAATPGIPSPREGAATAYDPATQSVVMFGGDIGGAALDDTWSWDGSGWSELHPPVSPTPRTDALMAYGAQSRSLVLTGGYPEAFSGGPVESATWTWDGSTWAPQPQGALPGSGTASWSTRLATDAATGQLILVTGLDSSTCQGVATWGWKSGSWARLDLESSLGAADGGLLGYDSRQHSLLLYSNGDCHAPAGSGTPPIFVWSWNGSAWSVAGRVTTTSAVPLPKMLITSAVAEAPGGGLLAPWAGTYILHPNGVSQVAAMPGNLGSLAAENEAERDGESVADDAARNEVVLFGGEYLFGNSSGYLGDTWTWDGSWHLAETGTASTPTPTPVPTPTPPPSPCASPAPQAGSADQLENLRMFSASSGWARRASDSAILHTTDGGAQWTVASPPLTGDEQTVDVSFLDPSTAEALTGTLYDCPGPESADLITWSTSDGGTTWTEEGTLEAPDLIGPTLDFVNPEDGWLFMPEGGGAMGSTGMAVYRTVDGGGQWSELATQVANSGGDIPDAGSFINAATGWITGYTGGDGDVFYVSRDGGATWSPQSLPGSSSLFQSGTQPPQFWSQRGGWLLESGFTPKGGGSPTSALYVTTDAGDSWSQIATPGPGQSPAVVYFIDPEDGWVLTAPVPPPTPVSPAPATTSPVPSMTLWATTDGGRTWSSVWSRSSEVQLTSLDFVTAEVGWSETVDASTGASGLLQTIDGGRTWRAVQPVITG